MSKTIRLAIAGVGNCASSLVQGIEYYRDADPTEPVPGLMHVVLGGYHVRDVEVVAAFDVDAAKVGLDVGKAIFSGQNNTIRFAQVGELGVEVQRGPTFDGLGQLLPPDHRGVPRRPRRRGGQALRDIGRRRARVLPAGGVRGGPEALRPGVPRRRRGVRQRHPRLHRLRPRVGRRSSPRPACPSSATTSSPRSAPRSSTASWPACSRTGAWSLDRTYQLNVGGNMDFKNMLERRAADVQEDLQDPGRHQPARQRHRGRRRAHRPVSDHVPWLEDRKWAYIRSRAATSATCP